MRKNPYAVVSMVLGILSFVQIFGLEKALAAGVFGLIALNQIKQRVTDGSTTESVGHPDIVSRRLAIIGIILSVAYILSVGFLFYFKSGEILSAIRNVR